MNDTNGVDICELLPAVEEPPEPMWRTKDGRKLALSEMTDEHLGNAVRMLRRSAERENQLATEAWGAVAWFQGEMAQYAVEGEAQHRANLADACLAWAGAMLAELARRGAKL